MSSQLRLSAALSVMAMSVYVLLGGDAVRVPLGPSDSHIEIAMPGSELVRSPEPFAALVRCLSR